MRFQDPIQREKLVSLRRGKPSWNKGRCGRLNHRFGKKLTEEHKRKISEAHLGKIQASPSEETRKKMRVAHVKNIEKNYGIAFPAYNKTACEYFKNYDIDNCTKGQYAMSGGGERYLRELGYWLDYINDSLKIIMEWNEKHHYDRQGDMKEKYIRRENEIKKMFPDYKFINIRG